VKIIFILSVNDFTESAYVFLPANYRFFYDWDMKNCGIATSDNKRGTEDV